MNYKLTVMKNAITSKAGLKALTIQKNSPKILFGVGVVGVVATVILASRATLKLDDTFHIHEVDKARLKDARDDQTVPYSDTAYRSDMAVLHSRLVMDIVKLYAPSVLVGAASIGALGGSHVILTRRNTGLAAAYASVDKAFTEYRSRVAKELGPDKELEFRHGVDEREEYSEKKNGEPKVTRVKTAAGASMYAKTFDFKNKNWNPTPEYNLNYIRGVQNWLNDRLEVKGYVILNDAYDELGLERTTAGCVVGWVKDPALDADDSYVDFGIWEDEDSLRVRNYMLGRDDSILIDFNVDGPVFEKLDEINAKKKTRKVRA